MFGRVRHRHGKLHAEQRFHADGFLYAYAYLRQSFATEPELRRHLHRSAYHPADDGWLHVSHCWLHDALHVRRINANLREHSLSGREHLNHDHRSIHIQSDCLPERIRIVSSG